MRFWALIAFALVSLVAGNVIMPEGNAVQTLSVDSETNPLRLYGGTALIVLGAFVLARTVVSAAKARWLPED